MSGFSSVTVSRLKSGGLNARLSGRLTQVEVKLQSHAEGSKMSPADLIEKATGAPPSPEPFLRYVEEKYGRIYGL